MMNLPFSADLSARLLSLLDSLLGAALGASFIYGAGAAYLRWRGTEGMGFGDVKLMGMVGAFLGVKLTIFTIFAASLAGSLFGLNHRADGVDQAHSSLHAAAAQPASCAPPGMAIRADGLPPLPDALRRLPGQHGLARTLCR